MNENERVNRRLRKSIQRMLTECEQAIRDVDSWADNRPNDQPLDAEWFKVQAAGCRKALAAIDSGRLIDPSWIQTK